jgi:nucleoid-associated protein YgaU
MLAIDGRRAVMMTSVSIAKVVASASVLIGACGAGLVFGLTRIGHEDRPAADTVTAAISAPQAAAALGSGAPPQHTAASPEHTATESPLAFTAALPNPETISAQLAGPPVTTGTDQSSLSFDIARVDADGDAVIAGRAPPGATVGLMRGGERLDRAVANASGEFAMVPSRLPAGSYELGLSAELPDGTVIASKHGVAVTVSEAAPSAHAVQLHAEYVPETTSEPRPSSEPRLRASKSQESAGPRPARAISSKVISRGDSLWHISRITYGDGSRYALVYRANRDRIRDPNLIYPGQTLVLPTKRN